MSEVPETRYVERGGVSLAYQALGHGERDVLYLSWPLAPVDLMWDDPLLARGLRRLAEVGRLVTFDGRGWGSSDRVDQVNVPAMQAWMDDIGTVLDEVGSEQAALVGMDCVALPLMLFAASHPERTSALVLINTFASFARDTDYPWGLPPEALELWIKKFGQSVGSGAISDLWAPSRATDPYYRRWANRAERLSTPPGVAGVAGGQYRLFVHSDVRGVLPSISAPTLVLYRTGSRVVRRGHIEYLASHIPKARLVELPGDDHVWFSGDVDSLISEILAFLTGASGPRTPTDRALATIVFTDIVGSTERAATVGDTRWRRELSEYHQLAASHLEGFQGRLVHSTGDGTLATFDGPARAIQFAVSIADAVAGLGLRLRVGVHTGEVEPMGTNIGGIAVHIAARVASLAGPDEVLVSAALPPLVVGSDIRFDDRGEHKLKGVPGAWKVFSVRR
ncbi:MAG TPA: adenylate/guanylate cyclase domain-containing protein [Acidimicrobiales bacterium]|nr:adenylate/guanylate cyclase domain-containing protein [Acidimicrobiales bacterium]